MWRKVLSVILSAAMVMPGTMLLTARRALACNPCCESCDPECSASMEVVVAPDENGNPWCYDSVDGHALEPCVGFCGGSCHSVGVPDDVRYSPGDPKSMPGLPSDYSSELGVYATKNAANTEILIHFSKKAVKFVKVVENNVWVWRYLMNEDARGSGRYKLQLTAGDEWLLVQDFVMQEQGSGLPKKYTFKGFGWAGTGGQLWKTEQAGGTTEYMT